MKLKLDLGIGRTKSLNGARKSNGFFIAFNDFRVELRRRHDFENSPYGNGPEKTHGWKVERNGLYKKAYVRTPLGTCVDIYKEEMTYAEAVGLKDMSIDWILDEFDSSFDDLAIASMKYHMDWSVAQFGEERRELYQDIIKRLEAGHRRDTLHTPDELEHIQSHMTEDNPLGLRRRGKECEECDTISQAYRAREIKLNEEHQQARHDFIKILPQLWS